jgi:hypothetical protein
LEIPSQHILRLAWRRLGAIAFDVESEQQQRARISPCRIPFFDETFFPKRGVLASPNASSNEFSFSPFLR